MKMTVGKALDLLGFAGPGATFAISGYQNDDMDQAKHAISRSYIGYDVIDGTLHLEDLVRGYGGSLNRKFLEKNVMKFLHIKGPRSKLETVGDMLDYVTYFGKTAFDVIDNKDNPQEAARAAYQTQYGVDLSQSGFSAWQPFDMLAYKLGPYALQKYIRKIIKIPNFKLTG